MTHSLTDARVFTSPVLSPKDGDADAQATFDPCFQSLANRTRRLLDLFYELQVQNLTGPGTFSTTPNIITDFAFRLPSSDSDDCFAVAVGVSSHIFFSYDSGAKWTLAGTIPAASYRSVIYGNADSIFVAVGDSGKVSSSTDGNVWTARTTGTTEHLTWVCYTTASSGIFVVVGQNGTILTSANGTTYTARTSGTAHHLNGVATNNSLIVAVGNTGTILTSSDNGVTWIARTTPGTDNLKSIVWDPIHSTWIAGGFAGIIWTSTDGIAWSAVADVPDGDFYSLDVNPHTGLVVARINPSSASNANYAYSLDGGQDWFPLTFIDATNGVFQGLRYDSSAGVWLFASTTNGTNGGVYRSIRIFPTVT